MALAAIAAALQTDDADVVLEDRHGRVLAALGLAVLAAGGWRLSPAVASVAASAGQEYAARFTATLRWAAAAAEGRIDWAEQDLGTKAALGRGSSLAGPVFVTMPTTCSDGAASASATAISPTPVPTSSAAAPGAARGRLMRVGGLLAAEREMDVGLR